MPTCVSTLALTLESGDLGYAPGHTYKYSAGSFSPSALDLTAGTGKQWNIASFSGSGFYNFTRIQAVSNVGKFPAATLAIEYEGKTLSTFSGTLYLRELNGDWQNFGEVSGGGTATAYTPFIPMGLPHSLGKTWSSSYTLASAAQTQIGTVLAEGKVTTRLGTFDALLVKLQTGSSIMYHIETEEYGRIASIMATNNYLYAMESGTKNVGIAFHPRAGASGKGVFYGAGYPGSLAVASEAPGQARMYSVVGRLLGFAGIKAGESYRMPAASGSYIGMFSASTYAITQKVDIRK